MTFFNGLLTPPRRGTDRMQTKTCSTPGTGRGWIGSWRALFRFFRMHWGHEPADRAVASWTAPVLWRFRFARLDCQSARRLTHSITWRGLRRFMESQTV